MYEVLESHGGKIMVTTFVSDVDGLPVVQIDTEEDVGPLRVCINEGVVYQADPESDWDDG